MHLKIEMNLYSKLFFINQNSHFILLQEVGQIF